MKSLRRLSARTHKFKVFCVSLHFVIRFYLFVSNLSNYLLTSSNSTRAIIIRAILGILVIEISFKDFRARS